MPAVVSRVLGSLKLNSALVLGGDFSFISPFLMTSAGHFCMPKSSPVLCPVTESFLSFVGCSSVSAQGLTLLSRCSRNGSLLTGVSLSDGCFSSVNSLTSVPKNCCSKYRLYSNISDLSCLEAENRPDMLSFFSRAKEVPQTSVKELDKRDEEAEVERLKKEEEQKKRDEEAENLRKEKEIEDKIGPPPEKPLPGDCCGNGCSPCIWDTYWEELEDYKKLRKSVEEFE